MYKILSSIRKTKWSEKLAVLPDPPVSIPFAVEWATGNFGRYYRAKAVHVGRSGEKGSYDMGRT